MRTDTGVTIRLEDYTPTAFIVSEVHLDFRLSPEATQVTARLQLVRRDGADADAPLVLDGDELTLDGLLVDGEELPADRFEATAERLEIRGLPARDAFTVTIETTINPQANTKLMGLYRSSDTYCTQCEAEGFRRITYFPDRPDVLAIYTVRIEGPKDECPLLLSNGNRIDAGELDENRHFAVWHDPHPKPSYLFALVAGNLGCVRDRFVTMSGRDVALEIYVEHGNEPRATYAMDALKRSMRWDEERFGREYDLDVFMLVAVSDFNMGAMENKGLNIFNDKYVLADPETATDQDYASIEAIVAHEYFHNWTGNRITCRDWFQLCLKEGLTVYRDHEFSADMRERGVKRISEVRLLRAHQFPEDAGPLAHPVRPRHYREINNFYTATVYEKGSEVVRMLHTILGEARFRAGINLYFDRHDGDAATIEDWLACFSEATGEDLTQFALWYEQPGTPNLAVSQRFDAEARQLHLTLRQSLKPPVKGAPHAPMHIPVTFALLGSDGAVMDVGKTTGANVADGIIHLREAVQTVVFDDVGEDPVVSLLRGFSAPVTRVPGPSQDDLAFIARHETDAFTRWDAINTLVTRLMIAQVNDEASTDDAIIDTLVELAADRTLDPAYRALCLTLPTEHDIARDMQSGIDPDKIHAASQSVHGALAARGETVFARLYHGIDTSGPFSPDADSAGQRALKNRLLTFLSHGDMTRRLAREACETATNMTERLHALTVLVHLDDNATNELAAFEHRFRDDPGVMDKWFMVQATRPGHATLDTVKALTGHRAFAWSNPNRVRALVGAFSSANATGFNAPDGSGYDFLCQTVSQVDGRNPQLAARLLTAMRSWRGLENSRKTRAQAALSRLAEARTLSRDVREMVDRMIA